LMRFQIDRFPEANFSTIKASYHKVLDVRLWKEKQIWGFFDNQGIGLSAQILPSDKTINYGGKFQKHFFWQEYKCTKKRNDLFCKFCGIQYNVVSMGRYYNSKVRTSDLNLILAASNPVLTPLLIYLNQKALVSLVPPYAPWITNKNFLFLVICISLNLPRGAYNPPRSVWLIIIWNRTINIQNSAECSEATRETRPNIYRKLNRHFEASAETAA